MNLLLVFVQFYQIFNQFELRTVATFSNLATSMSYYFQSANPCIIFWNKSYNIFMSMKEISLMFKITKSRWPHRKWERNIIITPPL